MSLILSLILPINNSKNIFGPDYISFRESNFIFEKIPSPLNSFSLPEVHTNQVTGDIKVLLGPSEKPKKRITHNFDGSPLQVMNIQHFKDCVGNNLSELPISSTDRASLMLACSWERDGDSFVLYWCKA